MKYILDNEVIDKVKNLEEYQTFDGIGCYRSKIPVCEKIEEFIELYYPDALPEYEEDFKKAKNYVYGDIFERARKNVMKKAKEHSGDIYLLKREEQLGEDGDIMMMYEALFVSEQLANEAVDFMNEFHKSKVEYNIQKINQPKIFE